MATQARADATRQMILDAAVELFAECGYGNVALSDVIARARVTRGAFHYHFATKETLAATLISYADEAMIAAAAAANTPTASTLENLIRSTFAMADLIRRAEKVRIGLQLGQSLDQISQTAMGPYSRERAEVLSATLRTALQEGDIDSAVDADAAGHLIWCGILGNYFLADAVGENVIAGLAKVWQVTLRGIAAPQAESFFQSVVTRVSAQYIQNPDQRTTGHPMPAPSSAAENGSQQSNGRQRLSESGRDRISGQ